MNFEPENGPGYEPGSQALALSSMALGLFVFVFFRDKLRGSALCVRKCVLLGHCLRLFFVWSQCRIIREVGFGVQNSEKYIAMRMIASLESLAPDEVA